MTRQKLLSGLGVAAALLGGYLLYRVVRRYDADEILDAVASVPTSTMVWAVAATMLGYCFLIAAEYLATRYVSRPIPFYRVALTAIAALGIGHSIGLAALSSGAVRYRMYRRSQWDLAAVGRLIIFSGLTVTISLATTGSVAILWHGETLARLVGVTPTVLSLVAVAALSLVAAYFVACARQPSLSLRGFRVDLPSIGLACGQLVAGCGHLLSVSAVLYVSLRHFAETDFPTLAALYVGADMSALIGHVPGGWGVIEYIVTNAIDGPHVLAGLIIFRTSYYLLPLTIGVAIFILDELSRRRGSQRLAQSAAASRR
jgi:uncharacterized membrane protein YbhN (UPF0104 family)